MARRSHRQAAGKRFLTGLGVVGALLMLVASLLVIDLPHF
jgi:hypothetical protein